jgi:hypothetical protein
VNLKLQKNAKIIKSVQIFFLQNFFVLQKLSIFFAGKLVKTFNFNFQVTYVVFVSPCFKHLLQFALLVVPSLNYLAQWFPVGREKGKSAKKIPDTKSCSRIDKKVMGTLFYELKKGSILDKFTF